MLLTLSSMLNKAEVEHQRWQEWIEGKQASLICFTASEKRLPSTICKLGQAAQRHQGQVQWIVPW